MKTIPLESGRFYHIYNRGINGCNLFYENENYEYFLHQYEKSISPVADTFAWVLMRNHFHVLVKIKKKEAIESFFQNLEGFRNLQGLKNRDRINQQFANFFQRLHQSYQQTGSPHGQLV